MQPFALERYFAKYEFRSRYILSASDCEPLSMSEVLSLADDKSRRLWNDLKFSYTESTGHPLLLDEIAKLYTSVGPGQALVAAPEELIFLAMNALLEKGDEVIVTTPAYQSLSELAMSLGCRVTRWELRPSTSGWNLDLQFLADHIGAGTKLIVINFPHNPTGHHISVNEQQEIVALARKHRVNIFSDEMYRGAEYRDEDRLPALVDAYEHGISLSGLSKSYALPGLRIGWLASRDAALISKCIQWRDYTTICNSAPSEILALVALKARQQILDRTRKILLRNIDIAGHFFARHQDEFLWLRPRAGSIAFPVLRKEIPIEQFCVRLAEEKSLLLAPGSVFHFPGNHFRIGLGRLNFPEAIDIFEKSL